MSKITNVEETLDSTKKAFSPLMYLLLTNQDKKVSTIIEKCVELTKAKSQTKTHLLDKAGNVFAIFCYYHKQWELVNETPFGAKASSATGLNTMCKVGTSLWTKQNKEVKAIGTQILSEIEEGKLETSEISNRKETLLKDAKKIDETNMPKGYELQEVLDMIG